MVDASWDNGGYGQPAKTGMPVWAKVLLGCGVAAVLALATCVGGVALVATRLSHALKGQEWSQFRTVVDELQTDAGAKAVYAGNPGLAKDFPTESAFLKAVTDWRPRLEPLPTAMPSVFTGRISYQVRIQNGPHARQVELRYRNEKGAWTVSRWEDGRLVALDVR